MKTEVGARVNLFKQLCYKWIQKEQPVFDIMAAAVNDYILLKHFPS